MEVERLAEQALHHSLALTPYDANFVEGDGNIFDVTDYTRDLDSDIDLQISRMYRVCHP